MGERAMRSDVRPEIQRPRLAGGIGEARAQAVEQELAQLASELGTGRDTALLRALAFYRKFVRRGRRFGHAPETFLRELLDAYEHRDIHAELARIREKVTVLTERRVAEAAAAKAGAVKEPSAIEIFRAAKKGKPLPRWVDPVEAAMAAQTSGSGSGSGAGTGSGSNGGGHASAGPVLRDGSMLASLTAAAMAGPATAAAAPAQPSFTAFSPTPSPESKSSYADRRGRLPKITF